MDMFMDKLAQRLNAQEIIKANTTAEVEELDKLRSRVSEYNECLDKLQKLVDESAAGLKGASKESMAQINCLVEESLAKIKAIQQDTSVLEKLSGQLESMGGQLGNVSVQLDSVNGQMGNLNAELAGKVDRLSAQLEERPKDGLEEKFAIADENVHKECVKVYRNVQAVVMEESGKQSETLTEISGKLNAVRGRTGIVLGISVAALVFSLAGAALQLLNMLGVIGAGL